MPISIARGSGILATALLVAAHAPAACQSTLTVAPRPQPDYAVRRARAFARLGKNLLIIRSRAAPASFVEARFDQDPNFLYFTGSERMLGAILVLDGGTRRAELFVPGEWPRGLRRLVGDVRAATLSADNLHVDRVSDWNAFAPYVDGRLAAEPTVTIYVDAGAPTPGEIGTPLDSLANTNQLWLRLVRERWPNANARGDADMLHQLRAVKDSAEIDVLRRVAAASAQALRAGLARFAPGRHQRDVEAAVAETCTRLGDGVSFWPWAMAGPNAAFPVPFTSVLDPHHLDRVMRAGEVARLDIGCAVDHYMGDVGRTVPVSGSFTPEQAEVVDLLVAAYRAGVTTIRDGATIAAVIQASVDEVARRRPSLRSAMAREAAAIITRPDGIPFWQLHGVGLDDAEVPPDTLRAGMVIDYEPIFVVAGQGFYMEDMILVSASGAEILTKGLPTTAREIEREMRTRVSAAAR
jgi:Xaa-Pro aminopeptidase